MREKQMAERRNLFGRFFGGGLPKIKPAEEMGASGVSVYGGYVSSAEKAPAWTGANRYRTSSEIVTNVSIVAAGVHHFLNLLGHPKWSVRASDDDDAQAVELAAFAEDVLLKDMDTPWSRVVRRAGMYRFHGYGIQEWTAKKRSDGRIGLRDVEPRPQHTIERWEIDNTGQIEGVWQRSPQTGELLGLPRGKFVYLVNDTLTDSPEGLGIFRHLAEPYNRLKVYLTLEARAFERDLRGIPIGRAPITMINNAVENGKMTQKQADTLINGIKEFVQIELKKADTGLVLDSLPYESQAQDGSKVSSVLQWSIDLLTGTGAGLAEMANAIDRLQREMARIIGTEHLMMGDQGGNRALAADKSRNLYLIANSVLTDLAFAFDKDLIGPVWKLNGLPEELRPTLVVEEVAFKDVVAVTVALRDMASAGAVLALDDPVIDDVRDMMGVSRTPALTGADRGALGITPTSPDDDLEDAEDGDVMVDA